jgi:hypothetical protein
MGDLGPSGCRCQPQNGVGIVGFMHIFHLPASLTQRLCNMGPTRGLPWWVQKAVPSDIFAGAEKMSRPGRHVKSASDTGRPGRQQLGDAQKDCH